MRPSKHLTPALAIAALALLALVVSLALSLPHVLRTEANVGEPTMQLQASGAGVTCDDAVNPTKCTVPLSGPFSMLMAVTNWPADPDGPCAPSPSDCVPVQSGGTCTSGCLKEGYISMATDLDWTGSSLTYNTHAIATEITWPDNTIPARNVVSATRVKHGALSTVLGSVPSTFKGNVVTLSFTCSATSSSNLVTLIPYDPATAPDSSELQDSAGAIYPQADTLTINCGTGGGAPTPTNTVAAAATPTNTPPGAPTATETPAGGPTPTNTPPGGPTATNTPPGAPTATSTAQPPTPTRTNTPRPPTATSTPASLLGDVNCDHSVTSVDAALVLQFDTHLITTLACLNNADVNHDSHVNSIDALYILWIVAHLYP